MSETTSFPADLLSLGVVPGERRRFSMGFCHHNSQVALVWRRATS